MKLYEIKSHYVDDYFVTHNYSIAIFKYKINAEHKLNELKSKPQTGDLLYIESLKIIERETLD